MKKVVLIILLLALCGKALAEPGIQVEVVPSSQTAVAGSTMDYTLKITNLDSAYSKTIKNVDVDLPLGWSFTLDPDIVGQTLSAAGSKETTIHVSVPSAAPAGSYSCKATVEVEYELFPGSNVLETSYSVFITQVTAAIPEFTTIAIPAMITIVLAMWGRVGK